MSIKRKPKRFAPYKSGLEFKVANILTTYQYEPKESIVDYHIERNYTPDFVHPKCKWLLIESKGFFDKRKNDALKYRSIKNCNPDKRVVFVWSNPDKGYGAKRKDGSRMSYAEWCVKYGFLFYHHEHMPKELISGKVTKAWVDEEIVKQRIRQTKEWKL